MDQLLVDIMAYGAYHKNDEIDTYEYVEERFISLDLHIKNFLESIGQTQLMNKR